METKRWQLMVMPPLYSFHFFTHPPPFSFFHSFPSLLSSETTLFHQSVSISLIQIRFLLHISSHFLTTFVFSSSFSFFLLPWRKRTTKRVGALKEGAQSYTLSHDEAFDNTQSCKDLFSNTKTIMEKCERTFW